MYTACWSTKGGAGTTVVAVSLGLLLSSRHPDDAVLLVDLGGDVPAVLGLPEPTGPGLSDWLAAGHGVPADGLARLEVEVRPAVSLLPRGSGELIAPERAEVLAGLLGAESRHVVVDCGQLERPGPGGGANEVARVLAAGATRSLLVTRPCYLALRRFLGVPLRPSGVVMVREAGRSLTALDVEDVVGAPVVADIAVDPAVARAVDAGLLAHRVPRNLARALRAAA